MITSTSNHRFSRSGHVCPLGVRPLFALLVTVAISGCGNSSQKAWLGVNTRFGPPESYGLAPDSPGAATTKADRQIDLEMIRQLGVTLIRDAGMSWAVIQPESKRRYDFSFSDELVRRAHSAQAELLMVFTSVPRWATADPADTAIHLGVPSREHNAAFSSFVRTFVDRYGHRHTGGIGQPVPAYQFLQNIEQIPPAEYAYWLKLFHAAVKASDRTALVVLGDLTSPGMAATEQPENNHASYFDRLLADPELQGDGYPYFDVVAFRSYPRRYPGRPAFDDKLAYVRQVMADHKLDLPVWVTAYGSDSEADQEGRQAQDLIKWALHGRAIGIDRLYLHSLRDEPATDTQVATQNYGVVHRAEAGKSPERKAAFRACQTLFQRLARQPRLTLRASGVYMLTGEGDPTYVIWKVHDYDPSAFLISGWWEIQSLTGQRVVRQGSEIKLTDQPILIQRARSPFIY